MHARPAAETATGIRRHVPELDGLRGIAILAVMFHHFVLWRHQQATCLVDRIYAYVMETGWTGVDFFFVLSGFLITGILFDAKHDPHYFRNFYARRVLRIFPLYYFILVLLFLVFPHLSAGPVDLRQPGTHQWTYWLYLSNFTVLIPPITATESRVVTWSLAIEEQFYLIWPAVIWLCDRRWGVRVALGLLGISVISRVLMAMSHFDAGLDYFWTPCHMDGLAIGAALALLLRGPGFDRWLGQRAYVVGAVGIFGTAAAVVLGMLRHLATRVDPIGQIFLYTSVAMVGASLLLIGLGSKGPVAGMLRAPPLRFFGKYSYGLYLFQAIVLAWVSSANITFPPIHHSQMPSQLLYLAMNFAGTILLAMLSFHLLERPFLRLKALFPETKRSIVQLAER